MIPCASYWSEESIPSRIQEECEHQAALVDLCPQRFWQIYLRGYEVPWSQTSLFPPCSIAVTCVPTHVLYHLLYFMWSVFYISAMLPLWTIVFETRIYQSAGNVGIPFRDIFIIFGYMTSSLTCGFVINRKLPKFYNWLWLYLPTFTILTLTLFVAIDLYNYAFIFHLIDIRIFFLCLLIVISGYSLTFLAAFIVRLPATRIIVLILEIGVRTSFIPCLIVHISFPDPERDIAKTSTVLCVLISLLPAITGILIHRFLHFKQHKADYSHKELPNEENSRLSPEVEPLPAPLPEVLVVDAQETAIWHIFCIVLILQQFIGI